MRIRILIIMLGPLWVMGQIDHYWQQEVKYKMDITFNSEDHQFEGYQELTYINNSPDTIRKVYYHLYFNAFQPGSMMDERQRSLPDPDKRIGERILNLKPDEYGYHRIKRLSQGEKELAFEIEQTVMKALLASPLPPGDSTLLKMNFISQVPLQIRRSGRNNAEGIDYTMTQWYPKLAAYDPDGWHPDFYIAREYYADYGTFEVNIDMDADYAIGGTGILLNEDEIWKAEEEDDDGNIYWELKKAEGKRRVWHFKAENVHDFAWAADPDYLRIRQQVSDTFVINHYFLKKYRKTWTRLPKFTEQFFGLMNRHYGEYPYPQFSVIQGGDGGMEYPMCTMLKGTGNLKGLVGVTVHESAHNWYYAIFGTNESRYPWMDEGFTSFTEDEILKVMWRDSSENMHIQAYANYLFLVDKGEVEPLSTPADSYERNRTYGISAYSRGALFLNQLRYIIGEKDFNRGMLLYYERWKFKHPDPWDFIRIMEEVSDIELDWYLEYWVYTTKTIDYGIEEVEPEGLNTTRIRLRRYGEMPMPLEVRLKYTSGAEQTYFIPLSSMFGTKDSKWVTPAQPWPWTHPTYDLEITKDFDEIESIDIDPKRFMCDVNLDNNSWPEKEEEKKED